MRQSALLPGPVDLDRSLPILVFAVLLESFAVLAFLSAERSTS